ncbi:MAG: inositol monophosphatase [Candidatus Riflebacteria bacterium]|nr:inositol monophosphatase [Candidatus Riflebacteria bacterium]
MQLSNKWRREAAEAGRIAEKAGKLLLERFRGKHEVAFKGVVDLVTEVDLASEALIRDELAKSFPGEMMLGEEGGGARIDVPRVWVVDPLDGTTNYAHGLPIFSVSIALVENGRPCAGAVHQPILRETFTAADGGGAFLNGVPIKVSGRERLDRSLVVTGFPYDIADTVDRILPPLRSMLQASRGVRRLGSAAMDLCYTAAGIFDCFWEVNLKPWDIAAGILLVQEAGGMVSDWSGISPLALDKCELLATNGHLHQIVLKMLSQS